VVVFTSDFGPTTATGPLFYRAANGMTQPINEVAGIGLGTPIARDAAKPYVGIINAGNTKSLPTNPATGAYGPCGAAPRRPAIDDPSAQPAAALCAPGLYNYFDSLAQATANLYGPYLKFDPMVHGGDLWSMPAIKSTLVGLLMAHFFRYPGAQVFGLPLRQGLLELHPGARLRCRVLRHPR